MDLLGVVLAQALLFFLTPGAEGLLDVALGILAADHEADLAGGVGRNRSVAVFDDGEDLLAGLLEGSNQGHVQPLILGCRDTTLAFKFMVRG